MNKWFANSYILRTSTIENYSTLIWRWGWSLIVTKNEPHDSWLGTFSAVLFCKSGQKNSRRVEIQDSTSSDLIIHSAAMQQSCCFSDSIIRWLIDILIIEAKNQEWSVNFFCLVRKLIRKTSFKFRKRWYWEKWNTDYKIS